MKGYEEYFDKIDHIRESSVPLKDDLRGVVEVVEKLKKDGEILTDDETVDD